MLKVHKRENFDGSDFEFFTFLWQASQFFFTFSIIGKGAMIPLIPTIRGTKVSCKLGKKNLTHKGPL